MKTKKNNKGFSLVELIVVVAIMAVLVAVLAPAYTRYVEKARLQKDNTAIAEIAEAMKIAAADEKVDAIVPATGYVVTIGNSANAAAEIDMNDINSDGTDETTPDAMQVELLGVIGSFTSTSKTYKTSATPITITLKLDANGKSTIETTGVITVPNATTPDSPQPTF